MGPAARAAVPTGRREDRAVLCARDDATDTGAGLCAAAETLRALQDPALATDCWEDVVRVQPRGVDDARAVTLGRGVDAGLGAADAVATGFVGVQGASGAGVAAGTPAGLRRRTRTSDLLATRWTPAAVLAAAAAGSARGVVAKAVPAESESQEAETRQRRWGGGC